MRHAHRYVHVSRILRLALAKVEGTSTAIDKGYTTRGGCARWALESGDGQRGRSLQQRVEEKGWKVRSGEVQSFKTDFWLWLLCKSTTGGFYLALSDLVDNDKVKDDGLLILVEINRIHIAIERATSTFRA